TSCDLAPTLEQQLLHQRVIPNRLAIFPDLATRSLCNAPIQLELTRDHRLSEVAFADEIRHDVDFADRFRVKQEKRVAQTRFLFPECAADLSKDFAPPNLRSVCQRRRTGIRVHSRAVRDDKKGSFICHPAKQRSTPNAQRPTLNFCQMLLVGRYGDSIAEARG